MINELATDTTFADLGIAPSLVAVLVEAGIDVPFPIQAIVIPDLAGVDVLGKAKTGSGKTLTSACQSWKDSNRRSHTTRRSCWFRPANWPCGLTRDLKPLVEARGFSLVTVYGGASMTDQIDALDAGVELLIATPGRLIDLMERRKARLDDIAVVCIDEADQMADMGFMPRVPTEVVAVPDIHQTYLYWATLDSQVSGAGQPLHDRAGGVREDEVDTETVNTMEHRFLKVHHLDKPKMAAALSRSADRTLMFTRTKWQADDLTEEAPGTRHLRRCDPR